MHALIKEWVEKAEGDFQTPNRELRVRKAPNYDAVCFHCLQFRYPGEQATKADASTAIKAMKDVRIFIRQRLGL